MVTTARDRFNDLCATRWHQGELEYGPEWKGRHPLWEMLEEVADAMNYAMVAKGDSPASVPKDLLLAVEALGTTVVTYLQALEAQGTRPELPWTLRRALRRGAPSTS